MPDIKIKGWSGTDFQYQGVPKIWLDAPESTEESPVLVPYTYGEAVSKTVEPDFSAGDMEVEIQDGELVSELTIAKPETLVPENIAEGVAIAGILGTFAGGGSSGGGIPNLPKLKYIIPITHAVTRYGSYGITLGSTTITAASNEWVYAMLFPPIKDYSGSSYRATLITYCLIRNNGYLFANSTFEITSPTISTGTMSPIAVMQAARGTASSGNSITIKPYINPGSKYGLIYFGAYSGLIFVYDKNYTGAPTILHENNYVTSTNTITVL